IVATARAPTNRRSAAAVRPLLTIREIPAAVIRSPGLTTRRLARTRRRALTQPRKAAATQRHPAVVTLRQAAVILRRAVEAMVAEVMVEEVAAIPRLATAPVVEARIVAVEAVAAALLTVVTKSDNRTKSRPTIEVLDVGLFFGPA